MLLNGARCLLHMEINIFRDEKGAPLLNAFCQFFAGRKLAIDVSLSISVDFFIIFQSKVCYGIITNILSVVLR